SSAFSAMFTTNARATILGGACEPWSGTWKNLWRKTARGSTDCQRSTTLQKGIWKWMFYGSELLLDIKSSVPILVARATRSRVYSCYACSIGHNLMFCHQSPASACVTGNGGVRSLWDKVASSPGMATEA